jgi:UDP-3-O-[3-hydroxymyristoyl] N-acetylglucosamine deacetylase / 3-hydroxyacyl-[acyl-carrier-protein] dehydratase
LSRKQNTIASPVALSGAGLHTNQEVRVELKPAEAGSGVVFVRTDLPDHPAIPLGLAQVKNEGRRTALSADGAEIHTIEHLLACLHVLGIDNLRVEVSGAELPGLDGSALPWWTVLREAGIEEQAETRELLSLDSQIVLDLPKEEVSLVALPRAEGLEIVYTLDYRTPEIPIQRLSLTVTPETFEKEIAPARTFCLESEAAGLRDAGLGKGANTTNTLVVGSDGKPLENSLRFPDEFVRHKVLDLIGDLYVLGIGVNARVLAVRSGHGANIQLAHLLQAHHEAKRKALRTRDQILDIREVMRILPHRYPFLLIDRVVELEGFHRAVGIKNVSINEPFFQGHWPDQPVMPGVLIVEAMAQLSGVLLLRKLEHTGKLAVLLSIDRVKLRRAVVPGDQLRIESIAENVKPRTGRVLCRARVDGKLAAEARIKFMLVDAS